MREQLRFVPARVEFDPTLANELAHAKGETMAELSREYEVGEATIWRALQ
jgi:hypothetical protein